MSIKSIVLMVSTLVLSTSVNAATIQWRFDATLSASASDPLNIDGESISMLLTFDDAAVWQNVGSSLYFPTMVAEVSITGLHTIAMKTASPAIFHNSGNTSAGVTEALGNGSYVDFIIDGITGITNDFSGNSTGIPVTGQGLLVSHLPTSISNAYTISSGRYDFVDTSVTISTVPVPAAVWLFGSGLIGLIGVARRKKA